jgi:hypothetical protein
MHETQPLAHMSTDADSVRYTSGAMQSALSMCEGFRALREHQRRVAVYVELWTRAMAVLTKPTAEWTNNDRVYVHTVADWGAHLRRYVLRSGSHNGVKCDRLYQQLLCMKDDVAQPLGTADAIHDALHGAALSVLECAPEESATAQDLAQHRLACFVPALQAAAAPAPVDAVVVKAPDPTPAPMSLCKKRARDALVPAGAAERLCAHAHADAHGRTVPPKKCKPAGCSEALETHELQAAAAMRLLSSAKSGDWTR